MRPVLAFLLALVPPGLAHAADRVVPVPFTGCPSDGQTGPEPAPRSGPRPLVPAPAAARLAYYSGSGLGVLAPRGWHCYALYGSDGTYLVVSPRRISPRAALLHRVALDGPAILLSQDFGATSGRFAVADGIARYFPAHRAFAVTVRRSGIAFGVAPKGPYRGDSIARCSRRSVAFVTPARRQGEGTSGTLAPGAAPVEGVAILAGEGEPDLIRLQVRLPSGSARLIDAILAATPLTAADSRCLIAALSRARATARI